MSGSVLGSQTTSTLFLITLVIVVVMLVRSLASNAVANARLATSEFGTSLRMFGVLLVIGAVLLVVGVLLFGPPWVGFARH